jgi:hypothetical protein
MASVPGTSGGGESSGVIDGNVGNYHNISNSNNAGRRGTTVRGTIVKEREPVFPDLHHKMSKKIAQLTRVIYHLNTINENHESEISYLRLEHADEMNAIVKDCAARTKQLELGIDAKKSAVCTTQIYYEVGLDNLFLFHQLEIEMQLLALQRKYESEKKLAQQTLEEYKRRTAEKETSLDLQFQQKIVSLQSQIVGINDQFERKLEEFEKYTQQNTATKEGDAKAINKLKEQHEAEISELVRFHNEKYQSMLIEQLGMQETLKNQAAQERNVALRAVEDKLKVDMAAQLTAADKTYNDKMNWMNSSFEDQLKKQRALMMTDMEKLLTDLRAKCVESEDLAQQLKRAEGELDVITVAQSAELQSKVAKVVELNAVVLSLTRDLEVARKQQQDSSEDVSRLQSMLLTSNQKISDAESTAANKSRECDQLAAQLAEVTADLETMRTTHTVNRKDADVEMTELKAKLSVSERDAESLRAEINSMGLALAAAREEIKSTQKTALKSTQDLERWVAASSLDKEAVMSKLREAMVDIARLNKDLTETKAQFEDAKTQLQASKVATEEQHATIISEYEGKLKQAHEKHDKAITTLTARADLLEQELVAQKETMLKEHTEKLDSMQATHAKQLQQMQESSVLELNKVLNDNNEKLQLLVSKHEQDVSLLNDEVTRLGTKIQILADASEAEKSQLKHELHRVETRLTAVAKELDHKRLEYERAENVQSSLKSQIESLREELQASQAIFAKRLESALQQRDEEWKQRLALLSESSSAEAEKLLQQLMNDKANALKDLQQRHEALEAQWMTEREQLKEKIRNINEISEAQSHAGKERLQQVCLDRDEKLAAMEADILARVAQMTELHRQQLEEAELQRKTGLAQVAEAAKHALESALQDKSTAHALSVQEILQSHASEIESINSDHDSAISELTERLQKEFKDKFESQRQEFNDEVASMAEQQRAQTATQAEANEMLKTEIVSLNESVSTLQKKLAAEQTASASQTAKAAKDLQQQTEQFTDLMNKSNYEHNQEMNQLRHLLQAQMRDLEGNYEAELAAGEAKLLALQNQYAALESRYDNRESRVEDLQQISLLEQQLREQAETLAGHSEEMKKLKREMLNREDMYNTKFGSKPIVGVMQVLKSDVVSSATTTASALPATPGHQMPTTALAPPAEAGAGGNGNSANPAPRGPGSKLPGQSIAPLPSSKPQYFVPNPNHRGSSVGMDLGFSGVGVGEAAADSRKKQAGPATGTPMRSSSK